MGCGSSTIEPVSSDEIKAEKARGGLSYFINSQFYRGYAPQDLESTLKIPHAFGRTPSPICRNICTDNTVDSGRRSLPPDMPGETLIEKMMAALSASKENQEGVGNMSEFIPLYEHFCDTAESVVKILVDEINLPHQHKTIVPEESFSKCLLGTCAYVFEDIIFLLCRDDSGPSSIMPDYQMRGNKVAANTLRCANEFAALTITHNIPLFVAPHIIVERSGLRFLVTPAIPANARLVHGLDLSGPQAVEQRNATVSKHLNTLGKYFHLTPFRSLSCDSHEDDGIFSNNIFSDVEVYQHGSAYILTNLSLCLPPESPFIDHLPRNSYTPFYRQLRPNLLRSLLPEHSVFSGAFTCLSARAPLEQYRQAHAVTVMMLDDKLQALADELDREAKRDEFDLHRALEEFEKYNRKLSAILPDIYDIWVNKVKRENLSGNVFWAEVQIDIQDAWLDLIHGGGDAKFRLSQYPGHVASPSKGEHATSSKDGPGFLSGGTTKSSTNDDQATGDSDNQLSANQPLLDMRKSFSDSRNIRNSWRQGRHRLDDSVSHDEELSYVHGAGTNRTRPDVDMGPDPCHLEVPTWIKPRYNTWLRKCNVAARMHEAGIPLRHLGLLRAKCKRERARAVVLKGMLQRALKNLIRNTMNEIITSLTEPPDREPNPTFKPLNQIGDVGLPKLSDQFQSQILLTVQEFHALQLRWSVPTASMIIGVTSKFRHPEMKESAHFWKTTLREQIRKSYGDIALDCPPIYNADGVPIPEAKPWYRDMKPYLQEIDSSVWDRLGVIHSKREAEKDVLKKDGKIISTLPSESDSIYFTNQIHNNDNDVDNDYLDKELSKANEQSQQENESKHLSGLVKPTVSRSKKNQSARLADPSQPETETETDSSALDLAVRVAKISTNNVRRPSFDPQIDVNVSGETEIAENNSTDDRRMKVDINSNSPQADNLPLPEDELLDMEMEVSVDIKHAARDSFTNVRAGTNIVRPSQERDEEFCRRQLYKFTDLRGLDGTVDKASSKTKLFSLDSPENVKFECRSKRMSSLEFLRIRGMTDLALKQRDNLSGFLKLIEDSIKLAQRLAQSYPSNAESARRHIRWCKTILKLQPPLETKSQRRLLATTIDRFVTLKIAQQQDSVEARKDVEIFAYIKDVYYLDLLGVVLEQSLVPSVGTPTNNQDIMHDAVEDEITSDVAKEYFRSFKSSIFDRSLESVETASHRPNGTKADMFSPQNDKNIAQARPHSTHVKSTSKIGPLHRRFSPQPFPSNSSKLPRRTFSGKKAKRTRSGKATAFVRQFSESESDDSDTGLLQQRKKSFAEPCPASNTSNFSNVFNLEGEKPLPLWTAELRGNEDDMLLTSRTLDSQKNPEHRKQFIYPLTHEEVEDMQAGVNDQPTPNESQNETEENEISVR